MMVGSLLPGVVCLSSQLICLFRGNIRYYASAA